MCKPNTEGADAAAHQDLKYSKSTTKKTSAVEHSADTDDTRRNNLRYEDERTCITHPVFKSTSLSVNWFWETGEDPFYQIE